MRKRHRRGTVKPAAWGGGSRSKITIEDPDSELAREYTAWQAFWRGIGKHRRGKRK